jgi:uncharacterized protein (TIGR02391 family)
LVVPGRDFVLTEEQVLNLPLDTLALEVLADIIANQEWNSLNWLIGAQNARENGKAVYTRQALQAFGEAWQWLENNGLIATNHEQTARHSIFVTRLGYYVGTQDRNLDRVRAAARLDLDLHPELGDKVRPQFLMGEYELAAFAAMRAVEIRVREMAQADASAIGVPLMRNAFGAAGPLADSGLERGEQVARMDLFAGAIGAFKNPTSHREVNYDDPTEASEVILVADLLMRILDRIASGRPSG